MDPNGIVMYQKPITLVLLLVFLKCQGCLSTCPLNHVGNQAQALLAFAEAPELQAPQSPVVKAKPSLLGMVLATHSQKKPCRVTYRLDENGSSALYNSEPFSSTFAAPFSSRSLQRHLVDW